MPEDETSRDDEQIGASAANSQENSRNPAEHLAPYKFQPGRSGNPSGRPKKKPITELYAAMLEDPEFALEIQDAIRKAVRKGSMAMVLQIKEMTDRVEGKVVQPIDADVSVSTLAERMALAESRLNQK